jgi:hypothetical protein
MTIFPLARKALVSANPIPRLAPVTRIISIVD